MNSEGDIASNLCRERQRSTFFESGEIFVKQHFASNLVAHSTIGEGERVIEETSETLNR